MPKLTKAQCQKAAQTASPGAKLTFLGRGAAGHVYRAHDMALKVVSTHYKHEVEILQLLHGSPLLVPFLGHLRLTDPRCFVIKFVFCGTNGYLLTRKIGLCTESEQRTAAKSLFGAIDYLHSKQILHLDPKPENVYFYENRWVLGDLGNACHSDEIDDRITYTVYYRHPKASIGHSDYTTDIYAMALTILELSVGEPLITPGEASIWLAYATFFCRVDLPRFLDLILPEQRESVTSLLTENSLYSIGAGPRKNQTPFLNRFFQTMKDYLFTFTAEGAPLFFCYWQSVLESDMGRVEKVS